MKFNLIKFIYEFFNNNLLLFMAVSWHDIYKIIEKKINFGPKLIFFSIILYIRLFIKYCIDFLNVIIFYIFKFGEPEGVPPRIPCRCDPGTLEETIQWTDLNIRSLKNFFFFWYKELNKIEVLKKIFSNFNVKHMWHLVDSSPWPFVVGSCSFFSLFGLTLYMHSIYGGGLFFFFGVSILLTSSFGWFRDVLYEGTFLGQHTFSVQQVLKIGMIFFICSEVMFFLAFFWGFFYLSMTFDTELGYFWPPRSLFAANTFGIALLNTILLVSSGVSITLVQKGLLLNLRKPVTFGFIITLLYAFIFLFLQFYEYCNLSVYFFTSSYGSCFFILTGLHGAHVIVGTLFLLICFYRYLFYHFSNNHFVGLTSAIWYWHFVDFVWLGLFFTIYFWGNFYIEFNFYYLIKNLDYFINSLSIISFS